MRCLLPETRPVLAKTYKTHNVYAIGQKIRLAPAKVMFSENRNPGDVVSDGGLAPRALVQEAAIPGLVLKVSKANMARSRNEREAFATAMRIYQAHNSHLPETEARRAVQQTSFAAGKIVGEGNSFSE